MFIEPILRARLRGWIEIICGSIFSGETEVLIRRLKRTKIPILKLEIFKPAIDTRFHKQNIVSHNEKAFLSTPVDFAENILLARADYITKLHAICMNCGNNASYSFRKAVQGGQVLLGETNAYEPRCRTCYLETEMTLI